MIFSEYIFNAFSFSSSVKGLSLYDDMLGGGVGVCMYRIRSNVDVDRIQRI